MGRLGSWWFVSARSSPPGQRLYPEHTHTSGALISRPDNTGHDQTSQNKTPAAGSSSSHHTDTDLNGTIDRTRLMQPDTQQLFCVIYLFIYSCFIFCLGFVLVLCFVLFGFVYVFSIGFVFCFVWFCLFMCLVLVLCFLFCFVLFGFVWVCFCV